MVSVDGPLPWSQESSQQQSFKTPKSVRFDMPVKQVQNAGSMTMTMTTTAAAASAAVKVLDSLAAIQEYVAKALHARQSKESNAYFDLIDLLSRRSPDPGAIPPQYYMYWLSAFSQSVSSLPSQCSALVNTIISLDWTGENEQVAHAFGQFLENLVSAHAVHVLAVTKMLVIQLRAAPKSSSIPPAAHFRRVHSMLRNVLALIPTGPSFMIPILTENFPHKTESLETHIYYLQNMLHLLQYAPVLRNQAISLIIDRIVQVDVEIQVDLDELDDDVWEAVQRSVFTVDIENPESVWNQARVPSDPNRASDSDSEEEDEEVDDIAFDSDDEDENVTPIAADFKLMVEKLDAMLRLMFQYIHDFAAQTANEPARLLQLFEVMLDIFDRTVLSTHRLRCTQYLWFYACSLDPAFPELFLGLLISRLFTFSSPTVIRVSAAAYLGSFIARAKFVPLASVRTCLKLLVEKSLAYVELYDTPATVVQPDADRFGVFYAMVQAIVYVFCFRWRELVGSGSGGRVGYGMLPPEMTGFQRVLMSRFAPLRVCSKAIVTEFARITHSLDIMYCYPLIDRSAPSRSTSATDLSSIITSSTTYPPPLTRSQTATDSLVHQHQQPTHSTLKPTIRLDAFFPFDPVALPVSKQFIDGLYQEWKNEDGDDSEPDGQEDSSDSDDDDDMMMSKSPPSFMNAHPSATLQVPGRATRMDEGDVEGMSTSFESWKM
ncbi:RNA polymerase I-specific transcription initiation factor RRN3 [Phlyctochytrium arcticum]|nr:RNA polymerase I-specific transcription initiation factor RRN3 [Phlyctochytrium arcticum]